MPSVRSDRNYRWMRGYPFTALAAAVTTGLGQELQLSRESSGLSPLKFASRLPSRLDVPTLFTYEDGLVDIEIVRLLELCMALDIAMLPLIDAGIRRAHRLLVTRADLRLNVTSTLREGTTLPREPAVQLAQAHRIIGHYDRLNEQLHKTQGLLAEQITRTREAEAVAAAAQERAETSERLRVQDHANCQAKIDQLNREHEEEVQRLKSGRRLALTAFREQQANEVAELLARNAELLQQLADARRNNESKRRRARQRGPADEIARRVREVAETLRGDTYPSCPLDEFELTLISWAAHGMNGPQMRAKLNCGHFMVTSYWSSIFDKLGTRSRATAVAVCLANEWLAPADVCSAWLADTMEHQPDTEPPADPLPGQEFLAVLRTRLLPLSRLTDQDRAVLALLVQGLDNPVIAGKLDKPVYSVQGSVRLILRALRVANRCQAVAVLLYVAAVLGEEPQPESERVPEGDVARTDTPPAESPGCRRLSPKRMVLAEDADPRMVAVYNTLPPFQRDIFRALGAGWTAGEIARSLTSTVKRVGWDIEVMGRKFSEPTYVGLAALARELFVERVEPVDSEGKQKWSDFGS